jgi:hypothetical protein
VCSQNNGAGEFSENREDSMRVGIKSITVTSRATLLGVSLAALSASALAAEYKMTVNQDRLIHAHREPQNWLR